ncbi:MAG: RNA-directed DNA polymerase, partial [Acholeplasmataceae bacterium]
FIDNTVLKLRKSLGARGILRLDISNFYGSFYTHNISCIGRGHNWAENQFRLSFENNASQEYKELAKLDKLVQGINQKRTHGLLIGPVTSFIIAEGLMTTIDDELSQALKTKLNKEIDFVRFIDDYDVFIQSEEDIPFILQTFTQILDKYGFVLGDSKTEFIKFPFYIYEDFKEIMIKEQELTSSKELLNIYSKLANLELAVKQKGGLFYFASHLEQLINDSNYSDAISLLLSLIKENAKSIPVACKTIIKHCKNGNQNFKKSVFNNMFNYLIGCIDKQYDWEQIWLIYTLIKLDSDMFKSKLPSIVTKHLSELAVVMIINEYVCEETLQNSFIEQAKNSSWLLKYELYRLNIVDEQFINTSLLDPKAIINFNILKENNIRLYKVQYNC